MTSGGQHNVVNGLILAGGKSTRMGTDKAMISYHGQPQFLHVHQMLSTLVDNVYISCRQEQRTFFEEQGLNVIADKISESGPLGAIYSALSEPIESAWLVVACDLPLLDQEILQDLKNKRNPHCVATAFFSPHDGLPEPLVAIWEKHALPLVHEAVLDGKKCPRKVLLNHPVELVRCSAPQKLMNVNHPHEINDLKMAGFTMFPG